MYLPDPIERIESRIDDLAFEQFQGVPDGMIRCFDCYEAVPLSDVYAVSAHPDAPAVCERCLDAHYARKDKP